MAKTALFASEQSCGVFVGELIDRRILLRQRNLGRILRFMKIKIWGCVLGIATIGGLGTTAIAGNNEAHVAQVIRPQKDLVLLVAVTGSRIPQRVYVSGHQVNSAAPVYVVQGQELANTGATTVGGLISLDPSVQVRRGP
jgi:hypothetical protein